jgi:hypothetical protein
MVEVKENAPDSTLQLTKSSMTKEVIQSYSVNVPWRDNYWTKTIAQLRRDSFPFISAKSGFWSEKDEDGVLDAGTWTNNVLDLARRISFRIPPDPKGRDRGVAGA